MSTAATDLPRASGEPAETPLRFVTAASLFDGHDAAINIMRRLIQAQGAEVVHLGHNRSVDDIVRAAIQEDADGIAVSSYQGGHNEFFRYMVDRLRENRVRSTFACSAAAVGRSPRKKSKNSWTTASSASITRTTAWSSASTVDDRRPRCADEGRSAGNGRHQPSSSDSVVDIAAMISALEEGVRSAMPKSPGCAREWQVQSRSGACHRYHGHGRRRQKQRLPMKF